jgi:hypothetical protein
MIGSPAAEKWRGFLVLACGMAPSVGQMVGHALTGKQKVLLFHMLAKKYWRVFTT